MGTSAETETPQWDVALAALAREEYQKRGVPLTLQDFQALARDHAIRLDDIMETMFRLAIHGVWRYQDRDGAARAIDQETLDGLYVNRRLSEQDLRDFDGAWEPNPTSG